MEDKLIIKNIKRKKECGLEMLIDAYGLFIRTIIRQKLYNLSADEDECLDDVLMCIWNNINSFDEKKNTFKNWVASVTRYKVIDYNRKYLKSRDYIKISSTDNDIENIKDSRAKVDKKLLENELRDEINNLLDNLKLRDKELFIRHYLEEKSVEHISKETGEKTENIYNRLSRGREKLRKILKLKSV
ncbi:MAG: sigma-70 family RNA polymerase sigma factor [Sarcina sp.]